MAVSRAAFDPTPVTDPAVLAAMYEVLDHADLAPADIAGGALTVAIASGLFSSNGEARRAISQGGFSINGSRVTAPDDPVGDPIGGEWLLLRAGRKRLTIGRLAKPLARVAPPQGGDDLRRFEAPLGEQDEGVVEEVRGLAGEGGASRLAIDPGGLGRGVVLGRHEDLGRFLGHLAAGRVDTAGEEGRRVRARPADRALVRRSSPRGSRARRTPVWLSGPRR